MCGRTETGILLSVLQKMCNRDDGMQAYTKANEYTVEVLQHTNMASGHFMGTSSIIFTRLSMYQVDKWEDAIH